MGSLPQEEPVYGQRLVPHLIDDIAHNDPFRTFCSLAKSSDISDGFQDVSYGSFANAINYLAWWIEVNLGKNSTFETVSYIGPPDLRYIVLTIAAQKTGYKARRVYTIRIRTLTSFRLCFYLRETVLRLT